MKILEVLKKIILGAVWLAFFAFAITMTVLLLNRDKEYGQIKFDDTTFIFIKNNIASENYKKGDLALVEFTPLNRLKRGDEVFAYQIVEKGKVNVDLGIVGQIHLEERAISYENGSTYSTELLIGKAVKVHKGVGTILSFVLSKWGFLFTVLVPSFLIFIYQVYALIVEIKYGSEEETEKNVKTA